MRFPIGLLHEQSNCTILEGQRLPLRQGNHIAYPSLGLDGLGALPFGLLKSKEGID